MKAEELAGEMASQDIKEFLGKRNNELEILNRISAIISQCESLDVGLGDSLDQLVKLTGAKIGSVHLMDSSNGSLKMVANRGVSAEFKSEENCIPVGECLCGEVAKTGELIFSHDLKNDNRLSRSACEREQFGSIIIIPLKSRDRVLGIFAVYSPQAYQFGEIDEKFLLVLGHQVGVAVENAQLYARTLELAVLKERGFIAQEIHDSIAQSLAYLNLQTKQLEATLKSGSKNKADTELSHIRDVIKDAYDDVRHLMVDYRVRFQDGENFAEALHRYVEDFAHRSKIKARIIDSSKIPMLPAMVEVQLFRIIQEGLSNVRKHALAGRVTVTLSFEGSWLEVVIQDDGKGFDPKEDDHYQKGHLGLEIMKERASKLEGTLDLESRQGKGTMLSIRIPIKKKGRLGNASD